MAGIGFELRRIEGHIHHVFAARKQPRQAPGLSACKVAIFATGRAFQQRQQILTQATQNAVFQKFTNDDAAVFVDDADDLFGSRGVRQVTQAHLASPGG